MRLIKRMAKIREKEMRMKKLAGAGKVSDFTPQEIWDFIRQRLQFKATLQYDTSNVKTNEQYSKEVLIGTVSLKYNVQFVLGTDENFFDEYDKQGLQQFGDWVKSNEKTIVKDITTDIANSQYGAWIGQGRFFEDSYQLKVVNYFVGTYSGDQELSVKIVFQDTHVNLSDILAQNGYEGKDLTNEFKVNELLRTYQE